MPTVRKLPPDQVRAIETRHLGSRKRVELEYDELLRDFAAGDYGETTLEADENRLTVRNRLKAAAGRRGLAVVFRRTKDTRLLWQLVTKEEVAAAAPTPEAPAPEPPAPQPESPAEAPASRRGRGRPRANAAAQPAETPSTAASTRRRPRKPREDATG